MTKKHYEAIARILATHISAGKMRTVWEIEAGIAIARDLADYFASDNQRFDRVRFLTACGIERSSAYMCYEEHKSGKYAGCTPPHVHE
jgi:hypothetical protein